MTLYYYNNHIIILSNTATDIHLESENVKKTFSLTCDVPQKSCCNSSFTFWSIASLKPRAFTRLFLQTHSAPKLKEASSHKLTHIRLWARSVCCSRTISAVKPTVHMLHIRSSNAQTCLWNIHPHTHSTHADVHTHASNGLSCNYSHLSKAHLDLWSN